MRILSVLFILLLAACSSTEITTVPIQLPTVDAPKALPLSMREVKWQVMNSDDLKALVAALEASPDPKYVIYVLDNRNFENMALNMEEIKRFMLEQQQVIIFYENLQKPVNTD